MKESLDQSWIGEDEIYKENILGHFRNPHNKTILKTYTHKGESINPLCGDQIKIYLKIEDEIIKEVAFEGKGCAISIASSSMLTDAIKEKKVQEVKKITKEEMIHMLGIPLGVVRLKCGLLALNTLKKMLQDDKNE